MVIHTYGHSRTYEMEALLKLFRPAEKFAFSEAETVPAEDEYLSASLTPEKDGTLLLTGSVRIGGETRSHTKTLPEQVRNNDLDREISGLLYPLLCALTDLHPAWGMLTGIRPVNLLRKFAARTGSVRQAMDDFRNIWHVTDEKTKLAAEILSVQTPILQAAPKNSVSIYLSVPFCPTRCKYCSFVSNSVSQMKKLIPDYYKCIAAEIGLVGRLTEEYGLPVDTVYIGGGTPTAIPREDLEQILAAAQAAFPTAVEWTVEAGRPDTIDAQKLKMLRDRGVGRISVNPQTFNDETLRRVGRAHTGAETVAAYELARKLGFDDINMDLIAALPGETVQDFRHTLDVVESLAPDSVTVHSLAIKRSSRLHEQLTVAGGHTQIGAEGAGEMIALARERLTAAGYRPYYLYRQKYMAGNLENVGYARPGKACLYNIGNMEETVSVLALGAGAISKWLFDRALRIERAPNVRNIDEYIARTDEMVQRKRDVILQTGVRRA